MDTREKRLLAKRMFTPSAPVTEIELFIGRQPELRALEDACETPGRHALLFGERGVGKTSLTSIFMKVSSYINQVPNILTSKVTCSSNDTYAAVMRRLLKGVEVPIGIARTVGFAPSPQVKTVTLDNFVDESASPADMARVFHPLSGVILIVDEFDRLASKERAAFADAIKVFSDNGTPVTLVVVGVAANVDQLIADHASVERAMLQIRVPRLSPEESTDLVSRRLARLEIADPNDIATSIAHLAQGLPHFVHLVGLGSALAAIEADADHLADSHLSSGVRAAIAAADQSIVSAYTRATYSPRVDALYTKVLCACAMAEVNIEGFFNARQVLPHMQRLHASNTKMAQFMKHLDEFSGTRGELLDKSGARRKYRYRFRNPMMKAYVLIQAVANGDINVHDVRYVPAKRVVDPYDQIVDG